MSRDEYEIGMRRRALRVRLRVIICVDSGNFRIQVVGFTQKLPSPHLVFAAQELEARNIVYAEDCVERFRLSQLGCR